MPDLVGHDRQPSAFLVYLCLWMRTNAGRTRTEALPLRVLAEGTGMSKRSVQNALRTLVRRRLITVTHSGPTSAPTYTLSRPWDRQ